MRFIKIYLAAIFILCAGAIGMLFSEQALALSPFSFLAATSQSKNDVCQGIGLTLSNGTCGDNGAQLNNTIKTALNILSVVIGLLAVVMIIVAGFRFITSGGDTGKVAGAKSAILYAIIGLIVVVFAQSIVFFVLRNV